MIVHLSGTSTTRQTPLSRVPSLLAFGLAPDHEMVVTVVGGDAVEYIDGVPGPFLDEPDGTIALGESHTFHRGTMLRATGEVDVEIEHVPPEPVPPEEPEPEPEPEEEG